MKIYAYHKNQFLVADDTGSGEFQGKKKYIYILL